MQTVLTIFMDGLIDASWIFIVAVGLTLTLGVLHILNLAHGNFYAIGAYLAATGVGWYYAGARPEMLGILVLLAAALVVAIVMGPLLERVLFRRLYRMEESVVLLATYALSLILEDATKLLWGANPYFAYEPYSLFGTVSIGGLRLDVKARTLRCAMPTHAQPGLERAPSVMRTLVRETAQDFGVYALISAPGEIHEGDEVVLGD